MRGLGSGRRGGVNRMDMVMHTYMMIIGSGGWIIELDEALRLIE
jgi:hypothetical protein